MEKTEKRRGYVLMIGKYYVHKITRSGRILLVLREEGNSSKYDLDKKIGAMVFESFMEAQDFVQDCQKLGIKRRIFIVPREP